MALRAPGAVSKTREQRTSQPERSRIGMDAKGAERCPAEVGPSPRGRFCEVLTNIPRTLGRLIDAHSMPR
jgi:hypothetical protein